ncbi:VIT1/CCC1 transporter family protein [Candidatus Microgenomates bacterium]|nr:VIT1/CCC1 transporter family protein [Candidatus Microgenomates bacterium]
MFHRHAAGRYIGDFVYGASDGIVTTFAVVAGATGASLVPSIVVILGLANIFADGVSMGAGNFLGARSEKAYAKAQRQKENWEIDHLPELEIDEIREIYRKKGFVGKDLERAVKIITGDRQIWVETMMRDELGIIEDANDDPKKHALATFAAFFVAGFIPLFSYLTPAITDKFMFSMIVGAATLFIVGSLRSLITAVGWFRGGMEMLLVGSGAALIAYVVGDFVEKLVS